jgi:signal recognition particle GTPase
LKDRTTNNDDDDDCIVQKLAEYYTSKETGVHLVETLIQSLLSGSASTSPADRATLIDMAVEAIPNLAMPHDDDDDDATMEQLNKQIENRMEHMTRMLKKTRLDTAKKENDCSK